MGLIKGIQIARESLMHLCNGNTLTVRVFNAVSALSVISMRNKPEDADVTPEHFLELQNIFKTYDIIHEASVNSKGEIVHTGSRVAETIIAIQIVELAILIIEHNTVLQIILNRNRF